MNKNLSNFLINCLLLFSSIILFALPHPNFLSVNGFSFLIYIAFVPLFLLVRRVSFKTICIYGFAYGFLSYCLYAYWLSAFHPMGIAVIATLYGVYLMLALPCLKFATHFFKKFGYLVQWIFWCAYEYIKTIGFSGFQYGVSAYTQWQNLLIIQIADIVGVWGICSLITFPSSWLSAVIVKTKEFTNEKKLGAKQILQNALKAVSFYKISAIVWLCVFAFVLVYGSVAINVHNKAYNANDTKKVTITLVQPNNDPWRGGIKAYRENLQTLINLSNDALKNNPNTDLVVWSETAFVPRIAFHYQYRHERDKFELVEELLKFLDNAQVPFLIGNDHAEMTYSRLGEFGAVDFNSALLFESGKNCLPPNPTIYKKMHLVPFTEYFPFEKLFPKLYEALLNGDTHLWEPGTEPVIFTVDDFSFAVPICFEDTFGYIGRRFVNNGAEAFVNISNDAWSKSLACQYQHLSMAVFRSIENRVPSVRSTASGQTSIIDINGKVVQMAEPFVETTLTGTINVRKNAPKTLYTRFGDFFGKLMCVASFAFLIFGIVRKICTKKMPSCIN